MSGSEENEKFYHYTPSGRIDLATINPSAAAQFEVGKEFYVDFTTSLDVEPICQTQVFEFALHDFVALACTDERGTVIGRAEHATSEPQYLVRYKAADGRQGERSAS